jgi:hypothetical protein
MAATAHRFEHPPTVQRGQHDIEHDQVVITGQRQVQAIETIAREIDDETRLEQAFAQVIARFWLIFDNQDLHVRRPMLRICEDCACLRRRLTPITRM